MTQSGWQLKRISPPLADDAGFITLAYLKQQCRIDDDLTLEDDLVRFYGDAAIEMAEDETRRAFNEGTFRLTLDGFPSGLNYPADWRVYLRRTPLIEITGAHYINPRGETVELEEGVDFEVAADEPPYLQPLNVRDWPVTAVGVGKVEIEFVAGYRGVGSPGDASAVPKRAKLAVGMLTAHFFNNRSAVEVDTRSAPTIMPESFRSALQGLRVYP